MTVNIWKSCGWTSVKEMNLKSDRHSNEHDLSSNKNKAWKNSGL